MSIPNTNPQKLTQHPEGSFSFIYSEQAGVPSIPQQPLVLATQPYPQLPLMAGALSNNSSAGVVVSSSPQHPMHQMNIQQQQGQQQFQQQHHQQQYQQQQIPINDANSHSKFVDIGSFCGLFGFGVFLIVIGFLTVGAALVIQLIHQTSDLDIKFIAKAVFCGTSLITFGFYVYLAAVKPQQPSQNAGHEINSDTLFLPEFQVRKYLNWTCCIALAHVGVAVWYFIMLIRRDIPEGQCTESQGTLECVLYILEEIIQYGILSIAIIPFLILVLGFALASKSKYAHQIVGGGRSDL